MEKLSMMEDLMNIEETKTTSFYKNPYSPKSAEEIFKDLAESRACYERGEYEDFDSALDEISKKYGL